jgi:hypothetical protein
VEFQRSAERRGRVRTRALAFAAGAALLAAAVGAAAAGTASAGTRASAPRVPALPKAGIWTALSGGMITEAPAPALWVSPNGVGYDVFPREVGPNNFTYEAVRVGPGGSVAAGPTDIFPGKHWGSIQFGPTLLGHGAVPLLVFDGIRGSTGVYSLGCVYGVVGGPGLWALQPWSLSHDCAGPVPAAAERTPGGTVLAAAWPGGPGVDYRVGVSSIPAAGLDSSITLTKATAFPAGMANDMTGNGHFYASWAQVFSVPGSRDGIYVKDVTSGATFKAPGTGTSTVSSDFPIIANMATTNSNTHPGVFLAYCGNSAPCKTIALWRVGAAKAVPVPSSGGAFWVSIAQGPAGRIWVAWYNTLTNRVLVTRSNKADNRFGPVEAYGTPCFEHGLLGLGGSPLARLDVGLSCVNGKLVAAQYVTQVLAALTLSAPGSVKAGASGVTVTVAVSDAGDPVAGATVKIDGKSAVTNAAGKASIHLPGSIKAGKYAVTAAAANYRTATMQLTVTK